MKVYVFGNEDIPEDSAAVNTAKLLQKDLPEIEFVFVKPNEDLPFLGETKFVVMDTVEGLEEVKMFELGENASVALPPRFSAHDYDLNFQLKYLKKLGKIGKVRVVGLPMGKKLDYSSIHSIFKKLVAQDMQGS